MGIPGKLSSTSIDEEGVGDIIHRHCHLNYGEQVVSIVMDAGKGCRFVKQEGRPSGTQSHPLGTDGRDQAVQAAVLGRILSNIGRIEALLPAAVLTGRSLSCQEEEKLSLLEETEKLANKCRK